MWIVRRAIVSVQFMLYVRFHDAGDLLYLLASLQILKKLGEIVPCDLSSSQTFVWLVVTLGNGNHPVPCFLRAQLQIESV